MKRRAFGKTGWSVSEVGLGCRQLGGDWGEMPEERALEILREARNAGVDFLDTADV